MEGSVGMVGMMTRAEDRRTHRRVSVLAQARLRTTGAARMSSCVDISMGGLALTGVRGMTRGERFVIEMQLAGHRFQTDCEVVRARHGELGARFLRLDQAAMTAIVSHCHAT